MGGCPRWAAGGFRLCLFWFVRPPPLLQPLHQPPAQAPRNQINPLCLWQGARGAGGGAGGGADGAQSVCLCTAAVSGVLAPPLPSSPCCSTAPPPSPTHAHTLIPSPRHSLEPFASLCLFVQALGIRYWALDGAEDSPDLGPRSVLIQKRLLVVQTSCHMHAEVVASTLCPLQLDPPPVPACSFTAI